MTDVFPISSKDLYAQLSQFEPRVTSMREIADQVFAQSAAADSTQLRSKLAVLNDRLTSLLRICGQYKQLLDGALRNRGASMSPSTPSGLNLSPSSAGSRTPHRPIVVLPSTEVCVYLNHVFFMALINILAWFMILLIFFTNTIIMTPFLFGHRCTVNWSITVSEISTRFVYGRARVYQHCPFQVRHRFYLNCWIYFSHRCN